MVGRGWLAGHPPSNLMHVSHLTQSQGVVQTLNGESHILLYVYRMSVQSGLAVDAVVDFIYRFEVRRWLEGGTPFLPGAGE